MNQLLELRGVTKVFGDGDRKTVAVDDLSFYLEDGSPSIIAVAGESGSGKTTMGMAVLGFLHPTEGQVLYRGTDIWSMASTQSMAYRREVQAVFQDPFASYNPFYKVDRLFQKPIAKFGLASTHSEARELIEDALNKVGLRPKEMLGRFPHQLSGGQRQRLVVARAILLNPRLLVADEPVSMVDASLRAGILEKIRQLHEDMGISVLYITHDLTTAYHISDGIMILYQGSVVEAGDVDKVIKSPVHPYTQLLVDSIPWADLTMKWGQQPIIEPTDEDLARMASVGTACCKYAARCPVVMSRCWESRPPLYRVEDDHVAACFQYETGATLEKDALGSLFSGLKSGSG
jgi:oligopeptide/dipeptide ABC transporter ATP-binding protein